MDDLNENKNDLKCEGKDGERELEERGWSESRYEVTNWQWYDSIWDPRIDSQKDERNWMEWRDTTQVEISSLQTVFDILYEFLVASRILSFSSIPSLHHTLFLLVDAPKKLKERINEWVIEFKQTELRSNPGQGWAIRKKQIGNLGKIIEIEWSEKKKKGKKEWPLA